MVEGLANRVKYFLSLQDDDDLKTEVSKGRYHRIVSYVKCHLHHCQGHHRDIQLHISSLICQVNPISIISLNAFQKSDQELEELISWKHKVSVPHTPPSDNKSPPQRSQNLNDNKLKPALFCELSKRFYISLEEEMEEDESRGGKGASCLQLILSLIALVISFLKKRKQREEMGEIVEEILFHVL